MEVSTLFLYVILIFTIFTVASCIDDKCAACNAVAKELELGLSKEKPRNHLDMRHRLDSQGQWRGKVIDYRVSELRIVELLDGLCDKMQDYTLHKTDSNRLEWIKVDSWDNLTIDFSKPFKLHVFRKANHCVIWDTLLEETEDEFAELMKKGSVGVGDVSNVLCQDLSKHCSKTSVSHENTGSDGGSDGEL